MATARPSKRASNRRIVVLARRAAGVAALVLVAATAHAQSAPEPVTQRHPDTVGDGDPRDRRGAAILN
jgi:hypothetical protein